MKLIKFYTILFLCSFYNLNAQINNATEIVNKSIEAMGGKEYIQSIKTLYTDFATEMEGRQVHWIVKEMKPNKGAFQIVYNNRIVYQNWFNGVKGFEMVNGEKKESNPEKFADKKYKKNIFNELDYIDSNLWKLDLIGEEKVGTDICYKVKATLVDGLIEILYFSKTSFYLLKKETISNSNKSRLNIVLLSNYKKFSGLTFFTEMKLVDEDGFQNLIISDLKINELIKEEDFE